MNIPEAFTPKSGLELWFERVLTAIAKIHCMAKKAKWH